LRRIKAGTGAKVHEGEDLEEVLMAMRWPAIAALCGALMAAACATTGLYQARDGESGYAETRLTQSQWRVEFVGDDFTSRETVETYLLYRAAELTAASGFDWFAMPGRAVSEEVEIIVEAERPQAYRARYWQPRWRRRGHFFWSDLERAEPARVWRSVHYSASADIVMGDGQPPVGAFVARDTIARIEPSIIRPHS
jgi:hypothetical protein